jgi:hypothetical protein
MAIPVMGGKRVETERRNRVGQTLHIEQPQVDHWRSDHIAYGTRPAVNIAQFRNPFPNRLKSTGVQPFCWKRIGMADRDGDNRNKMQIAPEITFEGTEPSPVAREAILKEIERLETHNRRITACRVSVIAPSHKHRHGTGFQVHIWITLPPHENIVVNHSHVDDARHEHVEVAIRDAFANARRQVDALAI